MSLVEVTDTQIVELGMTHLMLRGRKTMGHYLSTAFVDARRLRRMKRRATAALPRQLEQIWRSCIRPTTLPVANRTG